LPNVLPADLRRYLGRIFEAAGAPAGDAAAVAAHVSGVTAYLREAGLEVARIVVVVDREQGGDRGLREEGYPVHSLYRISEVISYYLERDMVDEESARAALGHVRRKGPATAEEI
jgi:orotate phosphoribosyltransferase